MRLVSATLLLHLISHSVNTLVLIFYASSAAPEDSGAMTLDQYDYGPRRVYALVHLVSHKAGWGADEVTIVPYVAVDIPLCTNLKSSTDCFCRLATLPSVVPVDVTLTLIAMRAVEPGKRHNESP